MEIFKSCLPSSRKTAIIISSDGSHHLVDLPMSSSEASFRFTGGVSICDVEKMLEDHFPSPMKMRQKLEVGKFYMFLPANRAGKELSDEQVEIVSMNIKRWRETHKKRNRVADMDSVPSSSVLWGL